MTVATELPPPPRGPRFPRRIVLLALTLLAACGFPRDPESTLEHVRGGVLRVGLVDDPPWATRGPVDQPRGVEAELVRELARSMDAEVRWNYGGETRLMAALKRFELDLVVGGVDDESPYRDEVGFTRPYYRGDGQAHVFAGPPGENAWVMAVEQFLRAQEPGIPERLVRAGVQQREEAAP